MAEARRDPPIGLIFVLTGLLLVAIGTFALPWAAPAEPAVTVTYADLMSQAIDVAVQTFADLYFSVLGLLLMLLVAVFGVRGTWPSRYGQRRRVHRTLAAMACAVAVSALLTAIAEVGRPGIGAGLAATGYVFVAVGVIVGPSRRRTTPRPPRPPRPPRRPRLPRPPRARPPEAGPPLDQGSRSNLGERFDPEP
ncbi:MAG: hypothetical protein HOV71_23665 [Hamadaea sp.]|nr:hypothetical protein [Hamadaea sp.]NUR51135.1 hypothetical protein [Hamadaea sp.]NUT05159.1 hypothetical protein [Hamadaea sp.]